MSWASRCWCRMVIPTSLGSGIFALLAAGAYSSVEEAQAKMCLPHKTYKPEAQAVRVYEELYQLYRKVYLAFGQARVLRWS